MSFICDTCSEEKPDECGASDDAPETCDDCVFAKVDGLDVDAEPLGGSWAWGLSPDAPEERADSREEAIAAARDRAEEGASVYLWSSVSDIDPGGFVPDADALIDFMCEQSYFERPESLQSDPWPDVDTAARLELGELLQPICEWARRHCSTWWVVEGDPEEVPPDTDVAVHCEEVT